MATYRLSSASGRTVEVEADTEAKARHKAMNLLYGSLCYLRQPIPSIVGAPEAPRDTGVKKGYFAIGHTGKGLILA